MGLFSYVGRKLTELWHGGTVTEIRHGAEEELKRALRNSYFASVLRRAWDEKRRRLEQQIREAELTAIGVLMLVDNWVRSQTGE